MKNTFLLTLLLFLTAACMYPARGPLELGTTEDNAVIVSPIIKGNADLDFKTLYTHIIKPKCLSCHQGAQAKPVNDPIDLSEYRLIVEDRFIPVLIKGKPLRSRFFISVDSGEMPPKVRLDDKEIAYIKKWIELCAPENDSSISDDCGSVGTPDDGPGSDDEPIDDDEPVDDGEPID